MITGIRQRVIKEMETDPHILKAGLKEWIYQHLITPKEIQVVEDLEERTLRKVWLITDHIGKNDSSYRIIFDPKLDCFGLECTLESNISWYMGPYGSFLDTVLHM